MSSFITVISFTFSWYINAIYFCFMSFSSKLRLYLLHHISPEAAFITSVYNVFRDSTINFRWHLLLSSNWGCYTTQSISSGMKNLFKQKNYNLLYITSLFTVGIKIKAHRFSNWDFADEGLLRSNSELPTTHFKTIFSEVFEKHLLVYKNVQNCVGMQQRIEH